MQLFLSLRFLSLLYYSHSLSSSLHHLPFLVVPWLGTISPSSSLHSPSFSPSRTSHWYSAAWQLIPLAWWERLREPLWPLRHAPPHTFLSPLVLPSSERSLLLQHPPDPPLFCTHSSLHLDLPALRKQLLKTPLTGYSYIGSAISGAQFVIMIYKKETCDRLNHYSHCPRFTVPAHVLDAIRHTYTANIHNWAHKDNSSAPPASFAKPVYPHPWACGQCDVLSVSQILQAFQHLWQLSAALQDHVSPWQLTVIPPLHNHPHHWPLDTNII